MKGHLKGLMLGAMLMLVAGVAAASTITLGTDTCGTLKQCINIPNDAGSEISLYGAPGYPFFYVWIDGTYYLAGAPSGTQMVNVSAESFVLPDPTNPANRQFTGQYLVISGTFTTYRTCTHSGRGQTCLTHWALVGGTIITQ